MLICLHHLPLTLPPLCYMCINLLLIFCLLHLCPFCVSFFCHSFPVFHLCILEFLPPHFLLLRLYYISLFYLVTLFLPHFKLTLTHISSSCTSSCYIGTLLRLDLSVPIGPFVSAVLICLLCIEDREYASASALRMEAADSCEKLAGLPTSTQCHHPKTGSAI